jgi:KDO2-lipid IV(A) lauroyltransferase
MPSRAGLALGGALGGLLGDLDRRHVAIAVDNLRHAFPDWDESRRLRTARGVYRHFGRVILDILWMQRRTRDEILSRVEVVGREHVEEAMRAGKGAIMVTAHIGNWELHGIAHGWLFGPIGVVARPLDNPALDARLCAFRMQGGNSVFYKKQAIAQTLRFLRDGKGVAILIDQNVQQKDGIFVDYFGRPAATTTVAAALGVKTGCALIPCSALLTEEGGYRLLYEAPVPCESTGDRTADVARVTQVLTSRIEGWVRETPDQWLWIHRRWKTRPPEPSPEGPAEEA